MDWIALFDNNSVDYVTRGPNTKRGEVSIRCPYCGEDDPSHHLGVSLTAERWGCHRSADHRGRSPARLIAAVLGCTFQQAKNIEKQYSRPDPDNLASALEALGVTETPPIIKKQPLTLPDQFRYISLGGTRSTSRFWQYIADRGFHGNDPGRVCSRYRLRCAVTGRYKDRIIFPFYHDKELVGWTGRAISNPQNAPRYLSSGPEIKETVFNYDSLRWGGRNQILVIAEGPFDALKLDYYGHHDGDADMRATCIFGTSMTLDQIWILNKLSRNYKHTYVLLDPDAIEASFAAKDWLTQRNISVAQVPDGIEDPGAMTPKEVFDFAKQLHEEADERKKHIPRRKA